MHGNLFVLIFVASTVAAATAALTYVKILNLCSGKNKMSAKTERLQQLLHTLAGRRSVAFQLSGQSVAGRTETERETEMSTACHYLCGADVRPLGTPSWHA